MTPVVERVRAPLSVRHAKCRIPRIAFLIAIAACLLAQSAIADEVDDILALKAKNRDRIKSYSAEYVVETKLPKDKFGADGASRMRYRLRMERLPKDKAKGLLNPWKTEIDVLEPYPLSMRVEGERIWFKKGDEWAEQVMAAQMREQFMGMGERFLGADPAEQRKHFDIRVLRHNSPFFGPRTITVGYVAGAKPRLFSRMEEDLSEEGLALETRIYDDSGKQTMKVTVTKHHKVKGVPVVDRQEAIAQTLSGKVRSTTTSLGQMVELHEDGR